MSDRETLLLEFMDKLDMSTNEALTVLSNLQHKEQQQEIVDMTMVNEGLIGRYFKSDKEYYYKVISPHASNEYRVSCLRLPTKPTYVFNKKLSRIYTPGVCYCGNFVLEGMDVVSKLASDFKNMTEISPEEYNEVAQNYLNELLTMDFEAGVRNIYDD